MARRAVVGVLAVAALAGCGGPESEREDGAERLPDEAQTKVLNAMVDVAGGCLGGSHASEAVAQLLAVYRKHGGEVTVVVNGYPTVTMEQELVDAADMLDQCEPRLAALIDRTLGS